MASCNDDFPLITEDDDNAHESTHNHHHLHHSQTFASNRIGSTSPKNVGVAGKFTVDGETAEECDSATFYSQTADGNPFATAGDESSDPNKPGDATPNGKRNPYYYRKYKHCGGADSGIGGGEYRVDYRKDREEWSDSAIACLLDAYTDKYLQLNRGNLRGRDWEEVAEIVSERCEKQKSCKSVEQCKNKIDNLKKRYKVELQRMTSGGLTSSNWHWFKKIEVIVGNSASVKIISDEDRSVGGNSAHMLGQSKRHIIFKFLGLVYSY